MGLAEEVIRTLCDLTKSGDLYLDFAVTDACFYIRLPKYTSKCVF